MMTKDEENILRSDFNRLPLLGRRKGLCPSEWSRVMDCCRGNFDKLSKLSAECVARWINGQSGVCVSCELATEAMKAAQKQVGKTDAR